MKYVAKNAFKCYLQQNYLNYTGTGYKVYCFMISMYFFAFMNKYSLIRFI